MLEFAAALAGVTIVTVNPALRAQELTHVLGQSKASGIFLIPEYRGTRLDLLLDAGSVHLWYHRRAEGRRAPPPRDRQ
jgi:fatty-acyl-CoA synthase